MRPADARRRRHPLADLLAIMWHYVRDAVATPPIGVPWLDVTAFDAQLDRIGRTRTVVGWAEVREALGGGRQRPGDAVLLTFDDGLVDHHRVVGPRLAARGWPGICFVMARRPGEPLSVGHAIHVLLAVMPPADLRDAVLDGLGEADRQRFLAAERRERAARVQPIDVLKRPLQRDVAGAVEPILGRLIADRLGPPSDVADALHLAPGQVDDLRRSGITIGGHGRRHPWFDQEPARTVRTEIADSAAFLAGDPRPWPFAYPYGASGPGVDQALGRAGFAAAFHASPRAATGSMDLGRLDGETAALDVALGSGATR